MITYMHPNTAWLLYFHQNCTQTWPLLTMPFFTISTQDLASLVIRERCMNTGFVEKKDVAEAPFVRLPAHRRWILHPPMGQTLWKGLRRIRPYGKAIVGRAMSLLLSPRPDQKGAAVSGLWYVRLKPFTDWNLESSIKFGRWKDIWNKEEIWQEKWAVVLIFAF